MTQFIGLGNTSRVGKDSLANYLLLALKRRKISAKKIPFAWKLKQITHELYAWAGLREPEWYDTKAGEADRHVVLPALNMTPVDIWVKFGTPAVREQVYDKTWIDYVMKTDHGVQVIISPDTRCLNEVEAIREKNGTLIKVVRPGFGPITKIDHELDGYEGWDSVVGQSGKMQELQDYARRLADWIKKGGEFPKGAYV